MPTLFASSEKKAQWIKVVTNDSIGTCSFELYIFNLLKLPPPPRAALLVYISSFWSLPVSQQWKRSFLMWDPKAVKSELPPFDPRCDFFSNQTSARLPEQAGNAVGGTTMTRWQLRKEASVIERCRWSRFGLIGTITWNVIRLGLFHLFLAQVWVISISQHLTFQRCQKNGCVPSVAHELVAAMPSSGENRDDRVSLDAGGALHWESSHKGLETLYRALLLPTQIPWFSCIWCRAWLGPRVSAGPKWHWRATGSGDYVFMGRKRRQSRTSSACGGDKSDAGDSDVLGALWILEWLHNRSGIWAIGSGLLLGAESKARLSMETWTLPREKQRWHAKRVWKSWQSKRGIAAYSLQPVCQIALCLGLCLRTSRCSSHSRSWAACHHFGWMYRIVSSRGDGNGRSVGSGGRDWRVSFFSEWCVVLCLLLQIGWPGRFLFPGDPDRHVCYFCFQAELIGSCCSSWRLLVLPGFQCAFSHGANACGMGRVSLAPGTGWHGWAGSTSRAQAAGSTRSSLCNCIFLREGYSLGLFRLFICIIILHCDAQVLAAADIIPFEFAWFGLGLHCEFHHHVSLAWPVSTTTLVCAVLIVLSVLGGDRSPTDSWEERFSSDTHLSDCTSGFVLRLAIFATFQLTQHWRPFRWVADGVLRLECCRFASNFCCFAKHDILSSRD